MNNFLKFNFVLTRAVSGSLFFRACVYRELGPGQRTNLINVTLSLKVCSQNTNSQDGVSL